jgi:predicted DNA-binding protein (UPF0251 family)
MQSPDDYNFDDPHHQAALDGIIERLLARRRVDRSRLDDPITIMLDRISDPFKRIEKPSEEPIKPLPAELPAASTVEDLRAHLGKRKGTRGGRKVQPLSYEPTLDLELIESMFRRGSTLAQIRRHLQVGTQRLKLELIAFLPHIAEEAGKRRGRKPREIDVEQVIQMRESGIALHTISRQLGVHHVRLVELMRDKAPHLQRRSNAVDAADVLRLHAEGLTQAQIAAELDCSEASVHRRIKEARLKEEAAEQLAEETKVREMRARGVGWKKIAAELHAGRDRLRSMYGQPSTDSTTSTVTPTALK